MIFLVSVFQKKEDLNFEVTREEEREKKKREKKKRERRRRERRRREKRRPAKNQFEIFEIGKKGGETSLLDLLSAA